MSILVATMLCVCVCVCARVRVCANECDRATGMLWYSWHVPFVSDKR